MIIPINTNVSMIRVYYIYLCNVTPKDKSTNLSIYKH